MVSRWSCWIEGVGESELRSNPNLHPKRTMVIDTEEPRSRQRTLRSHSQDKLNKMLSTLSDWGVKVWIVEQVPEADDTQLARKFFYATRLPSINAFPTTKVTVFDHRDRQLAVHAILDTVRSDTVTVIDPSPAFFDKALNLTLYGERSFYRDDDHLTRYGAEKLGQELETDVPKDRKQRSVNLSARRFPFQCMRAACMKELVQHYRPLG